MTDMIERLRAPYYWMSGGNCDIEEEDHTPFEAANEIERLRNRVAYLEFVSRTVQGEQIKLAADLMQEKIVSDRLRAALAPLVELAGAIRDDAEKATPGPWAAYNMVHADRGDQMTPEEIGEYVCGMVKMGDPSRFLFVSGKHDDGGDADICHIGNGQRGPANARLIVALRNALPAILAAAEAAGGEA